MSCIDTAGTLLLSLEELLLVGSEAFYGLPFAADFTAKPDTLVSFDNDFGMSSYFLGIDICLWLDTELDRGLLSSYNGRNTHG